MIGDGSPVSVTAEKYAILYVTSAAVCQCLSHRKVQQDNTKHHSCDLWSSQPLGFEIDLFNHRLFLFEVLILICLLCHLSPQPLCHSLFNSILINEQIHPGEINRVMPWVLTMIFREKKYFEALKGSELSSAGLEK